MQLAGALGLALVRGSLSAGTICEIFSLERLKTFGHLPFYEQLPHLFVETMAEAEMQTTPVTVQRLLEAQESPASKFTMVGLFLVLLCFIVTLIYLTRPLDHNVATVHIACQSHHGSKFLPWTR